MPLTSDDHNFFVRTPFEVFLDSMESPLSQESRFMSVEDKWGFTTLLKFESGEPDPVQTSFLFSVFVSLIS